jgi:hypothetical protein
VKLRVPGRPGGTDAPEKAAPTTSLDGTLRTLKLPPEQAVNLLENRHPHPNDTRITFREADHKYWIDGNCEGLKSSTGFIHQFFAEFDADRIIGYILKGKKWGTDPEYKYYKMSRQEIKDSWEANGNAASSAGTIM